VRPEPRPELARLAPAVHGGSDDPQVLDFSTGVSPLRPPDGLLAAARGADLSRYPHPTARPVREALAAINEVAPDQVVAGAGSAELIWALARAFAGPGRTGLVVSPAFGEYAQALNVAGASLIDVAMSPPHFDFPTDAVARALDVASVALAFVCRPSNPCLGSAPADALAELAQRNPRTLFVVDEAYLPMFEDVRGMRLAANVAILGSMTKVFALPGLRLGSLIADRDVASAVQAALPPWNVSSPAQAAGVVAARLLPTHAAPIRARIGVLRVALAARLASIAGPPARAGGPFLLYQHDQAAALAEGMRRRGVLVRHGASFGLPLHLRIGVRDESDQDALVEAWRAASGDLRS
jgi:histidinol-phosphate/aromatic aminotransferase/cobyric acid decarboxylase-like protein